MPAPPLRGLAAATLLLLAGCGTDLGGIDDKGFVPVTQAPMPSVVQPYPRIDEALACIRRTGVLRGRVFVVGAFADSTGKLNAVAPGSTATTSRKAAARPTSPMR